jgi:streptogramin lyase
MPNLLRVALTATVVSLAVPAGAGAFAVQPFTMGDGSQPGQVVAGPNGSAWFSTTNGIASIDTHGRIRRYSGTAPYGGALVSGAGGSVWFATPLGNIARLTPDGHITDFPAVAPANFGDNGPVAMALGGDGNIWFVTAPSGAISVSAPVAGRITPDGVVSTFDLPAATGASGTPPATASITAGPDGRLWILIGNAVDAITTSGTVTQYPIGDADGLGAVDGTIAAGSDDAIWVARDTDLLRLRTDGTVASRATVGERIGYLAAGPGGRMWLTGSSDGSSFVFNFDELADISSSGKLTIHPLGPLLGATSYRAFAGIAAADDRHLWVTDGAGSLIDRVTTGATCAVAQLVGTPARHALETLRAGGCTARLAGRQRLPLSSGALVATQSRKPGVVAAAHIVVTVSIGRPARACRLPLDTAVLARDDQAIIYHRLTLDTKVQTGKATVDVFAACVRASGRTITLSQDDNNDDAYSGSQRTYDVRLAGTRVAFVRLVTRDHYGNGTTTVETADVGAGGERTVVSRVGASHDVTALACAPGGAVAWIDGLAGLFSASSLHAWEAGRTTTLDTAAAPDLANLTVDATGVHWTNAGVAKSASLP